MRELKTEGKYTVPKGFDEAGSEVSYAYSYPVYDSVQDAIDILGEEKTLRTLNRMAKVDEGNTAREKAKSDNGHSSRQPLTAEQKEALKAQRAQNKAILEKIAALSPEQRAALGL